MPNFYPRPRPMPLTPPDNDLYYRVCGQQLGQPQYMRPGRAEKMYEPTTDAFGHPYAPPAAPLMFQPPPMNYTNMPTAPPPGLPHPTSFGPIAAPILPPINVPDRATDKQNSSRRERHEEQRRNQPTKNEKAVGGVSAVLDYEMDQMTDYVSEMAQSIVMPGSPVSPPFRKFVSGLLSSTRLPSSTILLGMTYLSRRMNMLSTPAPHKATDGHVWRMLTISLLLGSKFLDDNTFQNRSWSEVSGIPVAELNTLEHEWLVAIDWKLHVNPDTSEDFICWLKSWANWRDAKNKQKVAAFERLTPLPPPLSMIDTNVQRQRPQHKNYSPAPPVSSYGPTQEARQSAYQAPQHYDNPWIQRGSGSQQLSPPSAPDSGPNTPDYLNLRGGPLPAIDWFYPSNNYHRRQPQSATQQIPYHMRTAPYNVPFNQYSIWQSGHGNGCACGCGSRYNDSYFMTPGYGQQQPVAG